jgi:hypothetical protein
MSMDGSIGQQTVCRERLLPAERAKSEKIQELPAWARFRTKESEPRAQSDGQAITPLYGVAAPFPHPG